MIAVDTSALMAILLDEAEAPACAEAFSTDDLLVISAATVAEALIVAEWRGVGAETSDLVNELELDVASVSRTTAQLVADAYARWGKGVHPAGLNLGDCFAYVLAKTRSCPLLHVGADFSQTDVESAL